MNYPHSPEKTSGNFKKSGDIEKNPEFTMKKKVSRRWAREPRQKAVGQERPRTQAVGRTGYFCFPRRPRGLSGVVVNEA
jgi:hypothetical protein